MIYFNRFPADKMICNFYLFFMKYDIATVYELMASGDLDPYISEITFDEIGEGLGRLERHEVKGRLVANI